jgi:hypothetical protein
VTPSQHLTSELDNSLRFDAEYGQRLSNHLPMLLVALHSLGASDTRLTQAARTYATQLHPMPELQAWSAGDPWREPLGQPAAWPRFRDLFTTWLHEEGADETLRQVLPALMPGCGAAAFHGLIRTAYAVKAGHRAELAHALAYWASRWLDLSAEAGSAPNGRTTRPARPQNNPASLIKAAAAVPDVGASTSDYIVERLHHAAWQPGFAAAISPLHLSDTTLPALARHAAQLYARTGSFTVLHLVTSAWALRTLLPFVEEPGPALASYWRAYAAAAASVHTRLKTSAAPAPLPWPHIVQTALASDDEHVVKLVHACQEEQQAHGGGHSQKNDPQDDWQRAATRAVMAAQPAA